MKKQRNHSQLKIQDKSSGGGGDATNFFSLQYPEFKKEVMKMLKEFTKIINRNADHCNKELENMKRSQSKLTTKCVLI